MTPADLERVRVALTEHWVAGSFEIGGQHNFTCRCSGWRCYPNIERVKPSEAYADHIVAVLAAQDEAGGTGQ